MNKQKYVVRIDFVGGSHFEYSSKDPDEPNKIRYNLDNNIPLAITESKRVVTIMPNNILWIDVKEVE